MAGHRSEGVWMPPRNSREHDRYLSRHESARSEAGGFYFGAAPTAMRRLTEDATSGLAVPHLVHNLSAPNGTDAVTCELDGDSSAVMIGVIMGVIGSIMINIGQNFQATGLTTTPQAQDNPCSSRTWVIGLTIFIAGALLNFGAFTFASASVLVPIEAIQFVVNVIFNKYVNKKPISCRMVIGVCLTCLGTVSCVVFGPSDARCFTVDDLAAFWTRPLWWIYLVLTTGVAIVAYMTHEAYARAVKSGANPRHKQYIMPVTFALSSALFGAAQMIVHSKAIAELLELQFALIQPFPLLHWFFWLELTILGVTGCYWMFRMNKSLALYDPLFISTRGPHAHPCSFPRREPSHPPAPATPRAVPLLQSSYILFGVIAGGIFFEEFAGARFSHRRHPSLATARAHDTRVPSAWSARDVCGIAIAWWSRHAQWPCRLGRVATLHWWYADDPHGLGSDCAATDK